MTRSLRSAWLRRRTAVLLATATVAASFGWALAPGPSSSAQTADPPFTVEVSQTSGLLDGDVVDVTVRANPGTRIQNESTNDLYMCRAGVTYTSAADLASASGNCPSSATSVSTSSEGSAPLYTLADGSRAEGDITVGTGVADWSPGPGLPNATLECGTSAPCLLVVKVPASVGGGATTDHIAAVELTFATEDPNAGCGSRDPAAVASAGSDRVQDLWAHSTLAQCQNSGSAGASTQFAPRGEGDGLTAFSSGDVDVAYTAAGYRPVRGFDVSPQRPAVYTPVALNAVVLATMGGGQVITDDPAWPVGRPRPYSPPIRLTAAEVATLLGQGQFFLSFSRGTDVIDRNPQLASGLYQQTTKYTNPAALQDPTSVSLFMTSFLDSVAPDAWISGPPEFAPRGVDAQLGVATPGFASALTPISSQSQLGAFANVDVRQTVFAPQPGWALTDYATAIELGLQPVAIENAAGEFVLPTPESIAAGASTMTVEADGRRVPNPQATAAGAYPLTMIEYAVAPAETLVDGVCAPRPAEQAVLSSWLSFLTGPGQATLGDGFVPLTADLATQAEQAIAQVAASPSTAVCTPTGPGGPGSGGVVPGPGGSPTGATSTGSSGSGSGSGGTGSGSGAGLDAGALSPSTPTELAGAAELAEAAEPRLPPFLGIAAVSELISPLALLLVVVLTSGAAFLTSGRPAPPALAAGARRVRAGASGVVRRLPLPRRR